jgi:hypothetical protein
MNNKQEILPPEQAFKRHGFQPGQSGNPNGRPVGAQNVFTKELRTALLEALDAVSGGDGGTAYLIDLAVNHQPLFVGLLKGALPLKVEGGLTLQVTAIRETVVDPANDGT